MAKWTIGIPSRYGTHNANIIFDENGDGVAQVYDIPMHTTLEDVDKERFARGLKNAALIASAPQQADTIATLTAFIKEAREALEENDDILRGLANNHHFQMVGAGNKHHSENFSECQASTCKAALKQIRRAAEIRKKIQEVFP